jgi:3-dehydroquinate dehydratase-2
MKILIINGPNLNMLGSRDPEIYGTLSLADIETYIQQTCPDHDFSFYQSNVEGELINCLQQTDADAIIINPGAYSHTSVALRDALEPLNIPVVEVHISNIHSREDFRKHSLTGEVADGIITGFGKDSYILGVQAVENLSQSH